MIAPSRPNVAAIKAFAPGGLLGCRYISHRRSGARPLLLAEVAAIMPRRKHKKAILMERAMKRRFTLFAAGAVFMGTQALADAQTPAILSKRQTIKNCMNKQMAANRTLSYNEAAKACADKFKNEADKLAANAPTKP
jgi:hypothetical protein